MKLEKALAIAEKAEEHLAPYCLDIIIGGSIRRKKAEVKDIEIICVPKMLTPIRRQSAWVKAVFELGRVLKGKLKDGKYIQIRMPEGIKLDLFVAVPENYPMITLIRTGPSDFCRKILGKFNAKGYRSEGGYPTKGDIKLQFDSEEHIFNFLGMGYLEPQNRT